MRSLALMLLAIAAMAAVPAAAQDLPGRVGRVAYIEGEAALYQDPQEGWEKAYVNSPVTGENSVWTEADSRAELRVSGMAVRLDELTQLDVVDLDEALDAYLAQGTIAVRLRHYEVNERVVFTTPNARIELRANGRYRIDVDPERDESRLTVFTGSARVGSDGRYIGVGAGRALVLYGSPAQYFETSAT